MSQGGTMRIHAELKATDNHINCRFMDQGCGIAPERLPKLGEPFYSTKEKGNRTWPDGLLSDY